jgi:YD repeat-containing protein
VYDELGRLIQVIYEDGKKINYTYDAAGNRITVTNE